MIGKILGNRYEIIEKIGGGGMALVYKAKCKLLNRFVAVKILRPEFTSDEEFIHSFRKESQAAASLSHPNIVNIYDVGNDENDIYYIVMELVKGKTLKQFIKERGPLNPDKIINIAKQIALALQHAHNNHIVHRDIKPHNILITDDGRVKVTDFGIARAVTSSTVTNTGNVIGSVHYFSPEQARGGYIDEKSDLYSLGIVLYEMATGKVPFEGESPISIALKHIKEDITPPSLINPQIPQALEDIIIKATQKDQTKRYNSTKEICEDLEQALKQPAGSFVRFEEDDDSPTQVIPAIKDEELDMDDDYESSKRKKGNRRIVLSAIVTAFILALLFTGAVFYLKDKFFIPPKQVPKLVGISFEVAQKNLENLGFKAVKTGEKNSDEYEKGYVIGQEPAAGETRKAGYTVKLTVSKGPELVEVPSFKNKNINEISYMLDNADLEEGIVKYDYNSLPVGIIISQSPTAGEKVGKNTDVNFVVSQGPEIKMILMPNLVGEKIDKAKSTLQTSGLKWKIEERFDEKIEKDLVISQSFKAGSEVEENRTINLVVSKGPEEVTQPSEEDELQMKTVSFPLFYNEAKQEDFVLKIIKIQNGISTDVYSETQHKSDSGKRITIKGRDKATIEIYFDNELITRRQIDFETGKISDD
ncbi:Stk1 family PASTA domain-containing Ser/Thr kinase [Crassaminicella profunda]|uniref:Stk1 family PASTA domain-containing Ser/Thr kinase n=1 Tax=Crassaminicella profunda TaxID=1286698 RepID=UPI001CA766EC|nr:Stk1 family PASTA domain-containing Ser/Thr kinase [Crassaminicella profunda]QZY57119.1 Stk1 family PASTA domain-containing Ser/Thr kinase [Crassaminicella profunda]